MNLPATFQQIVATWDREKSIQKTLPKVIAWKVATNELFRELYIAREALSQQGGFQDRPTWTEYCEAIGFSRRTVNRHLQGFLPAELNPLGVDGFLPEPSAEDKNVARLASEQRVRIFLETGIRPQGWIESEDEATLSRLENERKAIAIAHQEAQSFLQYKSQHKYSRDYFAEMLAQDTFKGYKKLEYQNKTTQKYQRMAGDNLRSFLFSIDDLDERAKAALNLAYELKELVNDSIEETARKVANPQIEYSEVED